MKSKFPKRNSIMEKRARSVEEAVAEALAELKISKDDAVIEIIQEPSKGFLGLGAKEAIVKVSAKAAKKAAAPKKEAPKQEKVTAAAVTKELNISATAEEDAKKFITDILTAMGIEVTVTTELNEDMLRVNLEGDNMGIVIGKRGDTLDSLQYLTSLVVNQKSEDYVKVSIDTENYREKRSEALSALAERLAAKVARTGKKFALEPMNPYERRIIHSNLQDNEDVTTFSVGQEPYRKVVIAPKNPKQYGKKNGYKKNNNRRPSSGSKGGYSTPSYGEENESASTLTYKADFKPQQHKAEYKNFEEYLAAHSKD